MEGTILEFDRKGVRRSPSGLYPRSPAPSAAADAHPESVIIGANADSMYERLMRALDRADLTGPSFASE